MREPPAAGAGPSADRVPSRSQRLLQGFYLATPAFALFDLGFGINLRTTFLDAGPAARLLYYGVAFGCGIATLRWPRRAALIGFLESGTNIGWLVVGVMLRYFQALDSALGEAAPVPPFTEPEMVNLVVSAGVLMISYMAAQGRLAREGG